jgi:hypothetical protein
MIRMEVAATQTVLTGEKTTGNRRAGRRLLPIEFLDASRSLDIFRDLQILVGLGLVQRTTPAISSGLLHVWFI